VETVIETPFAGERASLVAEPREDVFDSLGGRLGRGRGSRHTSDSTASSPRARTGRSSKTVPCLDALDDLGVPAGVVSNWGQPVARHAGGARDPGAFRFVITSAEFGAEKPHPSIFLEAVQRLPARSREVLFVGDLLVEDVHGSRGAGLRPVLIDRSANAGTRCPRADLREVAQMVRQARLSSKG